MSKVLIAIGISLLSGCAVVKPITTPAGRQGFVLTCDGELDDWSTCYNAAATACNGSYEIIDRNGPHSRAAQRSLVAECKGAPVSDDASYRLRRAP